MHILVYGYLSVTTVTAKTFIIELTYVNLRHLKSELITNQDFFKDMERFGSHSIKEIYTSITNSTPVNTVKNKNFVWRQFVTFCEKRSFTLERNTTVNEIAKILTDWAFNMRKQNGDEYKEHTIKTIWNVTAKMTMEKFHDEFGITFNPFLDIEFKTAREAKNSKRKQLQKEPEKRKESSVALKYNEFKMMVNNCNEETPHGLQKKLFLILSYELAWRGGEGSTCLMTYFKEEMHNEGDKTGRIEYNPIFTKTTQGGSKPCATSKWLIKNQAAPDLCPVRLYLKYQQKRLEIKNERLFLTANSFWKCSGKWYKNIPVGKNELGKWTNREAKKAGLDTATKKITNHSLRATAVSQLAKSGVDEQQLIQITGHSSAKSISSYLQMDKNHHENIVAKMRDSSPNNFEESFQLQQPQSSSWMSMTKTSATSKQNHIVNYSNCTFSGNTFYS